MIKKNVTRRNLIERLNKKKKCFFFVTGMHIEVLGEGD